jgi:DNA-binding NarL/FixJ family response regulator
MGATPFLERCTAELNAFGDHADGREPGASLLTPQEQAVARLVCKGKSNQQVADELVVSVKTVGYHLGNAFSKLGVHSRTELCAALRERVE